jgi:Uncharacterized conserved protein
VSDQSDALVELGVEAYTYLYPLVIMDLTRRQAVNAAGKLMQSGPMNTFVHVRELPPADFKGSSGRTSTPCIRWRGSI